MHWRAFQIGFIFGTVLAFWCLSLGATGFLTVTDCVAYGAFIGALSEAIAAIITKSLGGISERERG